MQELVNKELFQNICATSIIVMSIQKWQENIVYVSNNRQELFMHWKESHLRIFFLCLKAASKYCYSLYRHYGKFIYSLGQPEKMYKYLGKDISSLATFFAVKSFRFYCPQYDCKVCSCFCWFVAVLWFLGRCYLYTPSKQAIFRITLHICWECKNAFKVNHENSRIDQHNPSAWPSCNCILQIVCNSNNLFDAFHDNEGRLMLLIMYLWYDTFYCNGIFFILGKNVRVWEE